ncbi:MAG: helix-turn-helix transcriptional regulator [Labilithrix sp.]|nr:helix-turn-helix transcriptional regulator [Labilithrix sp.]
MTTSAPPDHVLRRLVRARELVHDALGDALTLDELARIAGMSPFHFLRVFKATYGTTPGRFVTEARVDRARELLARGSSVTQASAAVGFASLGSFSVAFRRRFGQSPRELQRSMRGFGPVGARVMAVRVPWCFVAGFAALPAASRSPA